MCLSYEGEKQVWRAWHFNYLSSLPSKHQVSKVTALHAVASYRVPRDLLEDTLATQLSTYLGRVKCLTVDYDPLPDQEIHVMGYD